MIPKRFMLIAGETSGDLLAAELVRELRAGIAKRQTYSTDLQPLQADLAPRFFGAGGPRMAEAGVELAVDMTQHSVVGLSGPVRHLRELKRVFDRLFALALEREPHVIVCVDFSEFNTRFAAALKRHIVTRRCKFNNWEPKIVRYVSPQIWASREGRVYQMREDLDLLLSIIPFEKEWYAKHAPGLRVEFVGHPIIDRHSSAERGVRSAEPGTITGESSAIVALLPGSRLSEVTRHFPVMIEAFARMRAAMPEIRGVAVLPNDELAAIAKRCVEDASRNHPGAIRIQIGGLSETLSKAAIAIASTGTVTMECAYFGVPSVTLYKMSWWEYEIGKRMIKVKWLTMPNLLANEPLFPEFIYNAASPENISRAALELLRDAPRREKVKARLKEIIASLGGPGASRRAAEAILRLVP